MNPPETTVTPPPDPAPLPPDPVPPARRPARRVSLFRVLLLPLVLLAAAGGAYAYIVYQNPPPLPPDSGAALKEYLRQQDRFAKMADGYADADGDLLADPPTDPAKLLNPAELGFTVVATDDPAKAAKDWQPFLDHLSKATGKPVKYLSTYPAAEHKGGPEEVRLDSVESQLAALKAGKLHVTAFNTGAVQAAVNTAGFVPLFCPADAAGNYTYQMEIIVPAGSPAKDAGDLKGQTIALVALSSNSGGKAPLFLLKEQFGMTPGRDYGFTFAGSHDKAVEGVCAGRYAAACVAGDILKRMTEGGKADPAKYRSIYKSSPFPPLTFGVPHDLAPKVRADIEKGFATFDFAGNAVGDLYKGNRAKFARADYKKDFAYVRDIDLGLTKILQPK